MLLLLLKRLFNVAFRREVDRVEDAVCRVGPSMLLLLLLQLIRIMMMI